MTIREKFCRMVFEGVRSLAALVLCFAVLRALILTEHIVPQVIAVGLMLCLVVAYFRGAVYYIRDIAKRNTTSTLQREDQDPPAADDVLQDGED